MPPDSSLRLRARRYAAGFGGFQPDARRFLVAALLAGAAISLFYIDFNLYLVALGFDTPAIGLIAMVIAVPVSFGIAFFLTEVAPRWLRGAAVAGATCARVPRR